MNDYDRQAPNDAPDGERDSGTAPVLPGGIPLRTAATVLLIVAVVAAVWLIVVPRSDTLTDLPTPTAIGSPGHAAPIGIGGTPVGTVSAVATPLVVGTAGTVPAPATVATGAIGVITHATAGATTGTPAPTAVAGAALAVGSFVQVSGTGPDGIRFRFGPGLDTLTIRIVSDGEVLHVLGGPEVADGFTWWRMQDALGHVGWAAQDFVVTTAAPVGWSPPAASPTFPPTSAP